MAFNFSFKNGNHQSNRIQKNTVDDVGDDYPFLQEKQDDARLARRSNQPPLITPPRANATNPKRHTTMATSSSSSSNIAKNYQKRLNGMFEPFLQTASPKKAPSNTTREISVVEDLHYSDLYTPLHKFETEMQEKEINPDLLQFFAETFIFNPFDADGNNDGEEALWRLCELRLHIVKLMLNSGPSVLENMFLFPDNDIEEYKNIADVVLDEWIGEATQTLCSIHDNLKDVTTMDVTISVLNFMKKVFDLCALLLSQHMEASDTFSIPDRFLEQWKLFIEDHLLSQGLLEPSHFGSKNEFSYAVLNQLKRTLHRTCLGLLASLNTTKTWSGNGKQASGQGCISEVTGGEVSISSSASTSSRKEETRQIQAKDHYKQEVIGNTSSNKRRKNNASAKKLNFYDSEESDEEDEESEDDDDDDDDEDWKESDHVQNFRTNAAQSRRCRRPRYINQQAKKITYKGSMISNSSRSQGKEKVSVYGNKRARFYAASSSGANARVQHETSCDSEMEFTADSSDEGEERAQLKPRAKETKGIERVNEIEDFEMSFARASAHGFVSNRDDDNSEPEAPPYTEEEVEAAQCQLCCYGEDVWKACSAEERVVERIGTNRSDIVIHYKSNHPELKWGKGFCRTGWLIAQEDAFNESHNPQKTIIPITRSELHRKIENELRAETRTQNEAENVDPIDQARSNTGTAEAWKKFALLQTQVKKNQSDYYPTKATVIDAFCGIGSALVCLKRLKISLKTVISIEKDPVARRVYDYHHNSNKDKEVHYRSIDRFEKFEEELDDVMKNYGPIDIVIGGPPCTDFSKINANRQGIDGAQGEYMTRFAQLIDRIKAHPLQKKQPCFFLVENVVINEKNDQDMVNDSIGLAPIFIDSQYYSPCKRLRSYWTSIQPNQISNGSEAAMVSCLENNEETDDVTQTSITSHGWDHPAKVMDSTSDLACKCNTFMASSARINDSRMWKARECIATYGSSVKYERGFITARERSLMMGFPANYITTPVNVTFKALEEAFMTAPWTAKAFSGEQGEFTWIGEFANLNFAFQPLKGKWPYFEIKVPVIDKEYKFTREDYAKRLVGNAFSIPVVEHLLEPLKPFFQQRDYPGYDYKHRWHQDEE